MIPPFTGLRAGRRQAGAFARFALTRLSLSSEKKVAFQKALPAKMSASLVSGFYDQAPRSPTASGLTNDSVQASSGDAVRLTTRKIIGPLELLVRDVGQSITKVGAIVTGVGGYVEKSRQSNGPKTSWRLPGRRAARPMTKQCRNVE